MTIGEPRVEREIRINTKDKQIEIENRLDFNHSIYLKMIFHNFVDYNTFYKIFNYSNDLYHIVAFIQN
jgi:hypothetical protein